MTWSQVHPLGVHLVTTAEEAVQLTLEEDGLAILTQAGAWPVLESGLTMRPLEAEGFDLVTVLAVREDAEAPHLARFIEAIGKRLSVRRERFSSLVASPAQVPCRSSGQTSTARRA